VGAVNQQSEHLSDAQIEDYGDLTSGAGQDAGGKVEQHLAECSSCRSRVLDFQRTHMGLLPDSNSGDSRYAASSGNAGATEPNLLADKKVNTDSTPDCPNESDIRYLAAGLLSEGRAAELTQHAATCDHCGPLLRSYAEDFSDEFSKDEQAALEQLGSVSPAWLQQTARKMIRAAGAGAGGVETTSVEATGVETAGAAKAAAKSRKADKPSTHAAPSRHRSSFWKWALIPATAAVCALVAFGVWDRFVRDTPEKVEKLMAQAYTEQRPMEMRWPGAEWGKFSPDRGSGGSLFSEPEAQQGAAEVIVKKLTAPDHSEWLRPRAELELLEGHPDQAVSTLAPLENRTQSTALLLDLAIAYFQRGLKPDSPADKEHAIAILKHIISTNPNNLEALFNLGIAYTAIGSLDDASATWHNYLNLDPNGAWANEAKAKLLQIEKMHPQSRRE
jgi:hypothetical protein